jgi:hypothetical protein
VEGDRSGSPRRPARRAGGRIVRRDPQRAAPLCGQRPSRGGALNLIRGQEFHCLFETFEHTAFRLEVRDRYNSPSEAEPLRRFLADEPDDLAWFQDWTALVRTATAEGRRFSRVRVVSLPLTDYSRFGVEYSQHTIAAGDDIRYLPRDRADAIGLPDHDYWLFDSRKLAWMHFNETDDRFLGSEIIEDPAAVVQHNYWRDAARHWAVRRDDFAIEQDQRRH